MDFINILGLAAGALTTASFMPQVLKTWKSKSAKDVSLAMFIVLLLGVSLWILYGVLTRAVPVIAANTLTFVLVSIIIALKLKYRQD